MRGKPSALAGYRDHNKPSYKKEVNNISKVSKIIDGSLATLFGTHKNKKERAPQREI